MIKTKSFDSYINQLEIKEKENLLANIDEKFIYEEYITSANKKLKTIDNFINKRLSNIDLNINITKALIDSTKFFSYIKLKNKEKDIDFFIGLDEEYNFKYLSICKINPILKRKDNGSYGVLIEKDNKVKLKISNFNFFGKLFFNKEEFYRVTPFIEKEITNEMEKENFELIIKLKKDIEFFINFIDLTDRSKVKKLIDNNEELNFKDIKSQCEILSLKYDLIKKKTNKNEKKIFK